MEMFLLKCIPVYWGCSNIGDFFISDGIIKFDSVDQAIFELNKLDDSYYANRIGIIEENFSRALKYIPYEQNVVDTITSVFQANKLLS